jgi:PAS domain S-box-containing protein
MERTARTMGVRSVTGLLGWSAAVATAYFLLAKLGLTLASVNPSATPVWPPTGLAIAAALIFGYAIAPAAFVGAFLANVTTAGTVATSAAIAAGNTLECLIAAYLVNRWSGGLRTFDSPISIAIFGLVVLCLATPVSASIGVLTLSAAGLADWSSLRGIWITWWLGDLAGGLLFAPLIVLWWRSFSEPGGSENRFENFAVLLVALAVSLVAFSPLLPNLTHRSALGFLAVLPLLWAALRCEPRDTATVAVILSAVAIWGEQAGLGPFTSTDPNESFLLVLAFMLSASLPSLALSAAVRMRRRSEAILRASESRIRALAETAPSIIWTAAPDGTITFHNQQWLDYTGIPAEANARDWPLLVLHPDDRERCLAAWKRSLETGEPYEIEVRNRRHDGEYRWFLTRATPVRDETGKIVEWFGSTMDIQQIKEAGARQTLLLAELSHRVRNTLAVVQSIAARTISDERPVEETRSQFNDRLRALANAHDLLIESSWEGAQLADLLKRETEAYAEQMICTGPHVMLAPRAVQTFALLIHELTTNSCKHGALSTPKGRVTVSWWIKGAGANARFGLTWTERGGPTVTPPRTRGFGLNLLERAVHLEFGQMPNIAFEPAGFRFEFEIPAIAIVAGSATGPK